MGTAAIKSLAGGIAGFCTAVYYGCATAAAAARERIASGIAAHFRLAHTSRDLQALDEYVLRDIGVSRYDIPAAAGWQPQRYNAGVGF